MKRFLHLNLPLRTRRPRAAAKQPDPASNVSQDWRTPDGVEIWQAEALYQACVEIHEWERPLRVVLLEDYEALRQLYVGTVGLLNTTRGQPATPAELPETVSQ